MSLLEFATSLQASPLSVALQTHSWIVPTLQSVHILGVGIVFVSMLMVSLRVLGRVRVEQPLAEVWGRFAPFFWWALLAMVVTGVLLTLSEPVREFMTLSYRLKMLLLVVAVASAALFGRCVRAAAASADVAARAPSGARAAAVTTVIVWLAIIFLGRLIAYDDVVWGQWSPAVLGGANAT